MKEPSPHARTIRTRLAGARHLVALPADDTRGLHRYTLSTVQLSGQQQLPRTDNSSEGTAAWAQMQPSSKQLTRAHLLLDA